MPLFTTTWAISIPRSTRPRRRVRPGARLSRSSRVPKSKKSLAPPPFRAGPPRDMMRQFRKHYSREEARALLPSIREWLEKLQKIRQRLEQQDQQLTEVLKGGNDIGGDNVNRWVRTLVATKSLLEEFHKREIKVKDLDRGLIDFPSILGGREVFLCWEQDEDDIEFWHELDTGYAGRERL